jgi:hypothetical protein
VLGPPSSQRRRIEEQEGPRALGTLLMQNGTKAFFCRSKDGGGGKQRQGEERGKQSSTNPGSASAAAACACF